jgi:nucleotide-binding universal stress UspA family protein
MSSYMILTIVIGVVWLTIGVVLSIVMGRRGHISVGWGALGAMLGPLAVVAALATARHEKEERPSVVKPAVPLGGPVDVLVGIDGSPECRMALQKVIALFGPRLGRLCLATVVPFEDVPAHHRRAVAELHRYARLSGIAGAGEELLVGPPAEALSEFACTGGYQLLAVGGRGKGLSKAVIGSTASALAASCQVPTLIVSAEQPAGSVAA